MILTVTPNACVDKTYRVEDFRMDRVNRPTLTYTVAGGKGINVARVYQTLGGEAITTGFLGGINGRIVSRSLRQEAIADRFVRLTGETRVCIAIIDPGAGTQTEVNETGPEVSARAVRALVRQVERLLSQHRFEFVVLSGSLPPGTPPTLYADLIALARRHETPAVLDASGTPFSAGISARPWMVKPNRTELEGWIGRSLATLDEALSAARSLQCDHGIEMVTVTLGADGAALLYGGETWRAVPPSISFVSAVASGDSFLAAFLQSWRHGERPHDPASSLRLATGAGAANAAVVGAGFCSRESIFALADQADIRLVASY